MKIVYRNDNDKHILFTNIMFTLRDMAEHQLIINKTNLSVFEAFEKDYSSKAISICSLLNKFQIFAVNHSDSLHLKEVDFGKNDAFANFINKTEYDASTTYAEIIVDFDVCNRLNLTDEEMKAAIAHEVGHIMFFFIEDKNNYRGLSEEIICDKYVCQMGLKTYLKSLLQKLIKSRLYPENQNQQIQIRLSALDYYDNN